MQWTTPVSHWAHGDNHVKKGGCLDCLHCDKERLCYWIWLRTQLPLGCLWHAVLLHADMPGFINKCNMGQGVIADRNIVYHFRTKCRTLYTIVRFNLLKNLWFITLQLQKFPASLAVECWVPGWHILSSLSIVTSVAVKHPELFPLLQRQSLPICSFSRA